MNVFGCRSCYKCSWFYHFEYKKSHVKYNNYIRITERNVFIMKRNYYPIVLILLLSLTIVISACSNIPTSDKNSEIQINKNSTNTEKVSLDMYINDIFSRIKKNWSNTNKIWSNTNYKDHNVVIFYLDSKENIKQVFLLNYFQKKPRKLKSREWENISIPSVGGFANIEFEGKPSISLTIDDNSLKESDIKYENESYDLATHELFHFYHQNTIINDDENSRSTPYPIDYKPRMYRKMLFINLKKAFEVSKNKEKYLGKAKYWQDKWKKEYPEEAKKIHLTDIAEGSAKYFEILANITEYNMNKVDLSYYIDKLSNLIGDTRDSESYSIGAMAGLILSQKKLDWTSKFFEKNKTIDELLLDNVKPLEDMEDKKIEKELKKTISTINEENKEEINFINKFLQDKTIPAIEFITPKNDSIMYETDFLYKNHVILTGYTGQVNETSREENSLKNITVISKGNKILVPLTEKYTFKNGKLKVKSKSIIINTNAQEITDSSGRKVFLLS